MTKRAWVFLAGGVVALLIAGGAFYGGMAYQQGRQQSAEQAFFAARGGRQGGGFPGAGGGVAGGAGFGFNGGAAAGGGLFGTIKSINGHTLELSTPEDVSSVKLTDGTSILELAPADASALQPGLRISVRGDRDASGTITAISIQILGEAPPP